MMSRIVTTGGTERCTLSKNFFLPLARPMRPAGLSISSGSATSSSSGAMSSCSTWPSATLLFAEDLRTALTCPLLPCGPHRGNITLALRQLRSLAFGRKHSSHTSFFQVDGLSSSLAVPLWYGACRGPRARHASQCVRRLEVAVRRSAGALAATRQQSDGCAYSDVRWGSTCTTFNIITIITTYTSHGGCRIVYASVCLCVFLAPKNITHMLHEDVGDIHIRHCVSQNEARRPWDWQYRGSRTRSMAPSLGEQTRSSS